MTSDYLLFASFFLSSLALAQECSNASLSGPYAFSASGTLTVNSKTTTNSEVGRIVFDGKGSLTGYSARTNNGVTSVGSFTGTYAIGSDCTTTGKTTYADGTIDFDMVIVNAGSDFSFILRDPAFTESGNGTKIEAQGACSAATVFGAYGYQGDGQVTVDGKVFSLAEIGILTFNGKGGVTGTYSAVAAGAVERLTFTGSYELAGDCTANLKFTVGSANYLTNFVVANMGNTLFYSEVGPNTVIVGQGARTFPK